MGIKIIEKTKLSILKKKYEGSHSIFEQYKAKFVVNDSINNFEANEKPDKVMEMQNSFRFNAIEKMDSSKKVAFMNTLVKKQPK